MARSSPSARWSSTCCARSNETLFTPRVLVLRCGARGLWWCGERCAEGAVVRGPAEHRAGTADDRRGTGSARTRTRVALRHQCWSRRRCNTWRNTNAATQQQHCGTADGQPAGAAGRSWRAAHHHVRLRLSRGHIHASCNGCNLQACGSRGCALHRRKEEGRRRRRTSRLVLLSDALIHFPRAEIRRTRLRAAMELPLVERR